MKAAVAPCFFPFKNIVMPGIHAGIPDIGIHLEIAFSEEQPELWMVSVIPALILSFEDVMMPGIFSGLPDIGIHFEVSGSKEQIRLWVMPVVASLGKAFLGIMAPRINTCCFHVRVFKLIAFAEERII